jgi:hypothetical protein
MILTRARTLAGFSGALLILTVWARAAAPAPDKLNWKPMTQVILRIDDRAPKQWAIYQAGKKSDPLLLQLGTRTLVIYVRNQAVYEILPAQLERKGADLLWREADKPEKPLATSNWSMRDVGSAVRIQVKLSDEGRLLDIQIPQIPDLRRGIY